MNNKQKKWPPEGLNGYEALMPELAGTAKGRFKKRINHFKIVAR